MRFHRFIASLAMAALSLTWLPSSAQAAPIVVPSPPREGTISVPSAPPVSADGWVLYDADADLILSSSSSDLELPLASTTKMMTALVALKYGALNEFTIVSERAAAVGEAEIGLVPGERLRLSDLLTAIVARSANDAAMAMAEHLGGTVEGFVDMMNEEADLMGLDHTSFTNPHGLDEPGHYSSPGDLLELGRAVMAYPEYRERAGLLEADFPDAPDGTQRVVTTTNLMLESYPGTIGVKTGFTNRAGLVFVAAAVREGRTLFAVVMGSEGRRAHFSDASTLLDWGYERFRAVALVGSGSYQPPEPERVVGPEPEPVPDADPEPVVVTNNRGADGEPPAMAGALGWVGTLVGRLIGG